MGDFLMSGGFSILFYCIWTSYVGPVHTIIEFMSCVSMYFLTNIIHSFIAEHIDPNWSEEE
jgi:hypothetical protein